MQKKNSSKKDPIHPIPIPIPIPYTCIYSTVHVHILQTYPRKGKENPHRHVSYPCTYIHLHLYYLPIQPSLLPLPPLLLLQRPNHRPQHRFTVPPPSHAPRPRVEHGTVHAAAPHVVAEREARARPADAVQVDDALLGALQARGQGEEGEVRAVVEAGGADREVLVVVLVIVLMTRFLMVVVLVEFVFADDAGGGFQV